MKPRYYTWICDTCNEVFKTRQLLINHWNEFPDHKIKKSCATHKGEYYCQYCGRFIDQLNSLHLHEKHCKDNPNRVHSFNYGIKMSDEFKKAKSDAMKRAHKEGRAFTFADLKRRSEPSYPEQWLMNVIKNENLNSDYVREYKFHTFSLDFAWVDNKKVIEMDGRLHKISEYQQDCDKRKDALLKEEGWDELRIDWEYCCNNTKEVIQQIKDFIGERNL